MIFIGRRSVDRRAGTTITLLALLLTACDKPDTQAGWTGTIDTLKDTLVVTTLAVDSTWPPVSENLRLDIVWNSDQLVRPTGIAIGGNSTIYVADVNAVHQVQVNGASHHTIGRKGNGPGEFQLIHGLWAWDDDSLLIWDPALRRMTWMTDSGGVLHTLTVLPEPPYTGSRPVTLHPTNRNVLLAFASGLIRPDGPADTVVISELNVESGEVERVVPIEDVQWISSQVMGPKDPFGPRAVYAFGPEGVYAVTNGVDYCIKAMTEASDAVPLRICRQWEPPASSGLLSPSAGDIESLGAMGTMIQKLIDVQEPSSHWNSIQEMIYDSRGRIWVRPAMDTYRYHPFWLHQLPHLRPPTYRWEVFDPGGKLSARYDLPSRFHPMAITDRYAYGTVDAEDGTMAIGRVNLESEGVSASNR